MKLKKYILPIITIIILVFIDQFTKLLVINNMEVDKTEIPIIGNALVLRYIKNSGAAWGSFSSQTIILSFISIILIVALVGWYIKLSKSNSYKPLKICITFVVGGAIGNLIDRVRLHYVVDFIYFKLINFPIFNFADICVTVSMFVIVFLCIFVYKDIFES